MKPYENNRNSGFSIIELLIVLAVMGILGTMSYGYLISSRAHGQLERAELQVASFLNEARNLAVSEEVNARAMFDEGGGTFWLEVQDRDTLVWSQVGTTRELAAGVSFVPEGITLTGDEARFTPRGTLFWGGDVSIESSAGEISTLSGDLVSGKFPLVGGNLR